MAIKVETPGWKRWVEVQSFEGKDREGNKIGRQAFRNTLTGQMVFPEKGWDGDLAKLDHGETACVTHSLVGDDEFWTAMAAAKNNPLGEVIKQENGRTIIRY
ncbi:MAG: hypothetical protein ABSG90_11520 [Dehalococcoidia bacterium]|jgi:hypothetical protein